MQNALAGGLVELLRSELDGCCGLVLVASLDGFTSLTHGGLEFALDGAIALGCLLVGLDALDLRLDICHAVSFVMCWWAQGHPGGALRRRSGCVPSFRREGLRLSEPKRNDTR